MFCVHFSFCYLLVVTFNVFILPTSCLTRCWTENKLVWIIGALCLCQEDTFKLKKRLPWWPKSTSCAEVTFPSSCSCTSNCWWKRCCSWCRQTNSWVFPSRQVLALWTQRMWKWQCFTLSLTGGICIVCPLSKKHIWSIPCLSVTLSILNYFCYYTYISIYTCKHVWIYY